MFIFDSCSSAQDMESRRIRFMNRKLEFLKYTRDALERRLSAVNASIKTMEAQIDQNK